MERLWHYENGFSAGRFPRCGKKFSMAWKTPRKIFHGVENPDYSGGPPRPGQDGGEAEALAVRPDQSSSRMRR
jgi:hypothetical protein